MIIFASMKMRKTLGIGQMLSEGSIIVKSMPKLKDWQRLVPGGKGRKANKRETEKKKATRSCTRGCRRSTKSI